MELVFIIPDKTLFRVDRSCSVFTALYSVFCGSNNGKIESIFINTMTRDFSSLRLQIVGTHFPVKYVSVPR